MSDLAAVEKLKLERALIRADLIRRLFAVAISVGFATTLVRMDWVLSGNFPTKSEFDKIAVLGTALLATVASWDGYLLSLTSKPLLSTARYFLDIFLVFIYMYLLLAAEHPKTLLPTLVVIFALYFLWDIISIIEHRSKYVSEALEAKSQDSISVLGIYARGLAGSNKVSNGPIITVYWALYFVFLFLISKFATSEPNTIIVCISAATGLLIYREDKIFRKNQPIARPIVVFVCLLISLGLFKFFE